jgi:hypothetical protein
VRSKARELLGRDSESLSDRNFPRILKDAHDGDVIDLRRRGDDFEIARAAEAESVSAQLAKTAANNAPPPASQPTVPRGMGPRGATSTRGRVGRPGAPPADFLSSLLSVGVVGPSSSATPTASHAAVPAATTPAPVVVAAPAETVVEKAPARERGRKPAAAKKSVAAPAAAAARKNVAAPAAKGTAKKGAAKKAPAAKRPPAKKTAARAEA